MHDEENARSVQIASLGDHVYLKQVFIISSSLMSYIVSYSNLSHAGMVRGTGKSLE